MENITEWESLNEIIEWMDTDLDENVALPYKTQPLAQDWARVCKIGEEYGEVIDALIGFTGQNPRKGFYGEKDDLFIELCDVAATALYAIQHFTKDSHETLAFLVGRMKYHQKRRQDQLGGQ